MRALVVGGGSWGTAFAGVLRGPVTSRLACRDAGAVAAAGGAAARTSATCRAPASRRACGPCRSTWPTAPGRSCRARAALARPTPARRGLRLRRRASSHARQGPRSRDAPAALGRARRRHRARPARVAALGAEPRRGDRAGQPAASVSRARIRTSRRPCSERSRPRRFRVYASGDVRGVQLCGAAKNVIAIAAGICDGLAYGDNARAALITRGLAEMTRLGSGSAPIPAPMRAWRAWAISSRPAPRAIRATAPQASCSPAASRPRAAEAQVGMVVEGLHTAPALAALAREAAVDLPITDAVCSISAGRRSRGAGRPAGPRRAAGEF